MVKKCSFIETPKVSESVGFLHQGDVTLLAPHEGLPGISSLCGLSSRSQVRMLRPVLPCAGKWGREQQTWSRVADAQFP